jgi:hypothetical protein
MTRLTAVATLAAVLMAAGAAAQAKPSFAGEWKKVAARDSGRPGVDLAITQSASTITVRDRTAGPETLVYHLDGTASRNTVAARGGGAPAERVSKVTWNGGTLIVLTTTSAGAEKQTFSLAGDELVVDTSASGRDGGSPTRTTYTRYVRGYGG